MSRSRRTARVSAWAASIFKRTLAGRHGVLNLLAGMAVARVFEIPPERLREAVATFTIGKMRGERLEHNGIIIWNDCYNSNPEAVRAMLDVLRRRPPAAASRCWGRCSNLATRPSPAPGGGRYAAESGIDVLVGVRGAARFMVEEAVRAGMPPQSVHFFERPRRRPATSSGSWSAPATPSCSKARAASGSSGRWRRSWRNHAVLAALRKALADRSRRSASSGTSPFAPRSPA